MNSYPSLSRAVLAVVLSILLVSPVPLSAQSAASDPTPLQIGSSAPVSLDGLGVTRFNLDAGEGQTIALRWEAAVASDHVLKVTTGVTNASGEPIPAVHSLDTTTTSTQVYTLAGPAPYRVTASIDDGASATLTVLDGDPIAVLEQPPIGIGEMVTGVIPAEGELVVYPLNVQPGDVFTVHVLGVDPENRRAAELAYPLAFLTVVRDASGRIVEPDARTDGRLYTATDALPLRLEMARYHQRIDALGSDDAAYNVRLDPGNTIAVFGELVGQGGLLASGQRVEEDATGIAGDRLFTLDAEEGETVTLDLAADWNYLWDVGRMLDFQPNDSGIIDARMRLIRPVLANTQDSSSPRQACVCLYTFEAEGPPPYVLSLIQQINDPHIPSQYAVQVDRGDTVVRNQLATLAPGGLVQGSIPAWDGTVSYYALDVDPESTITVNWGSTELQYFIAEMDGDLVLPVNNPWDDGFSIIDLSVGTPPFFVSVNIPEQTGRPYALTLAEGETPLAPGEAALIPNTPVVIQPASTGSAGGANAVAESSGVDTTTTTTTTTGGATACTVTASGSINQRGGPGTTFAVSGALAAGSSASADGQATGDDGMIWYRLTTGTWVRSDLVSAEAACSALPTLS